MILLLDNDKKKDNKKPKTTPVLSMTSYRNNIQKGSLNQVDGAYLVLVSGTEEYKKNKYELNFLP